MTQRAEVMEIHKLQQEKSNLLYELSSIKEADTVDRINTKLNPENIRFKDYTRAEQIAVRLHEIDAKIKEFLLNKLEGKLENSLKLEPGEIDNVAYKNPNATTATDTFNKEEFQKAVEKAKRIIENREVLKSIPDYGLLQLVIELITEYKDRADRSMFKEEKLEYLKKYFTKVLML